MVHPALTFLSQVYGTSTLLAVIRPKSPKYCTKSLNIWDGLNFTVNTLWDIHHIDIISVSEYTTDFIHQFPIKSKFHTPLTDHWAIRTRKRGMSLFNLKKPKKNSESSEDLKHLVPVAKYSKGQSTVCVLWMADFLLEIGNLLAKLDCRRVKKISQKSRNIIWVNCIASSTRIAATSTNRLLKWWVKGFVWRP